MSDAVKEQSGGAELGTVDPYPNEIRIPFQNEISCHYFLKGCDNDPKDNGRHQYVIASTDHHTGVPDWIMPVNFQKGDPRAVGHNGALSVVVLEMLIDHLRSYQDGPYKDRRSAIAITHLETAANFLHARQDDRDVRGVLGKHEK